MRKEKSSKKVTSNPLLQAAAVTSSSNHPPKTFHHSRLPLFPASRPNPTQKKYVKKKGFPNPCSKSRAECMCLLQSIMPFVYLLYTGSRAPSSLLALEHFGKHVGHGVDTPFNSESLLLPLQELAVADLVAEEVLQSLDE